MGDQVEILSMIDNIKIKLRVCDLLEGYFSVVVKSSSHWPRTLLAFNSTCLDSSTFG